MTTANLTPLSEVIAGDKIVHPNGAVICEVFVAPTFFDSTYATYVQYSDGRTDYVYSNAPVRVERGVEVEPTLPVTVEAHNCALRRSYNVTFSTEEQAVAYIAARQSTHAFHCEADLTGLDALAEALYPTCEHGLSLQLCAGPGHYPMD